MGIPMPKTIGTRPAPVERVLLPSRPGWRFATCAADVCLCPIRLVEPSWGSTLWRSSHTDCQSTRAEGPASGQVEGEDACAPRRAAEARRMHPRDDADPEEAELGASEGR